MPVPSYILSIVVAAIVLISLIDLLRRGRLRERHALWWLVAGLVGLLVTLFPQILDSAAAALGVGVPLNLAFFGAIIILFLVSVQQSVELTQLESRTRILAERIALLEDRLRCIEDKDNNPCLGSE